MLGVVGKVIEYNPAEKSTVIKIKYTGIIKGNQQGENSMILRLAAKVAKKFNANCVGKYYSFKYTAIPGSSKETNILTVQTADLLDIETLPHVSSSEILLNGVITNVKPVKDRKTGNIIGYLYMHNNHWCRLWIDDFKLSNDHVEAVKTMFEDPTFWTLKAKYVPKVQSCYNEFGEIVEGNCCVFRMTEMKELEHIGGEEEEEPEQKTDQGFIDNIFEDEDYQKQYNSFIEEKEAENKEFEEKQEEDITLKPMNAEQGFHFRAMVLTHIKEMVIAEQDKEVKKALLDHYMWLVPRYEQ